MKKTVAILLVILMTACALCAGAATYTLPEKMQKQQEAGSGLKGSFTLEAEGTSDLMTLLAGLNGREIQIRSIAERESGNSMTTLYVDAGENVQQGLVEIMSEDGALYFRTDYTGNTVYTLGNLKTFWDLLTAEEGQNIQPWSMLKNMFSVPDEEWETQWAPVTERYLQLVENWMSTYAAAPATYTTEDGQSAFEMKFTMQPAEIRSGILQLITAVLDDEEAVKLLSGKMEPEVSAVYLNKDLLWYYREALDAMELNGPVTLSRCLTTKGEEISSEISLPLGTNPFGFDTATASVRDGKEEWIFSGKDLTVRYIPGETKKDSEGSLFTCGLVITPAAEGESLKERYGAYQVTVEKKIAASDDETGKKHYTDDLSVTLEPDLTLVSENSETYAKCEPLSFTLNQHFSGKPAQNSATTLELTANYEYMGNKLNASGKIKTTSASEIVFFSSENAVSLLNMNETELQEILTTLMKVGK